MAALSRARHLGRLGGFALRRRLFRDRHPYLVRSMIVAGTARSDTTWLAELLDAQLPLPRVVPQATEPAARPRCGAGACGAAPTGPKQPITRRGSRPSRYYSWSELMRCVFAIDVLECPRCKASPMRILAAIHPATTTRATLKSPGLPTRAPPIAPAPPAPLPLDWSLAETEAPA